MTENEKTNVTANQTTPTVRAMENQEAVTLTDITMPPISEVPLIDSLTVGNGSQSEDFEERLHCTVNRGLLDKSIRIMNGAHGGAFFAKYLFDSSRGIGFIQLILQYPDGVLVPLLLCKNICKLAEVEGSCVGTVPIPIPGEIDFLFRADSRKRKMITPNIKTGITYNSVTEYSEFVQYERPDFSIPMNVIWKRIVELWEKLPITTWNKDVVVDDIYAELLAIGEEKAEENPIFQDAEGVFLTRAEIEGAIQELGYGSFNDLRRMFEIRGLWIKDRATLGYQYSKKVDGKMCRFYKLRKVSQASKVSIEEKYCIEYTEK